MSFFITTIIIAVVFWILLIYCKNRRLYLGEPVKYPYGFYLAGFVMLFIPIINILFPLFILVMIIFNSDYTLKSGKETIGRKIIRFLTEKYF